MEIREMLAGEMAAVVAVQGLAFGEKAGPEIVALVEAMLGDATAEPWLSLVAEENGVVIGHALFTRVTIGESAVAARILAPLAVHPDWQGKGIGRALIEEGFVRLGAAGVAAVFVLGYPAFYRRMGFAAVGQRKWTTPYPLKPELAEAWMVRELRGAALVGAAGEVGCCAALSRPELWRE